MGPRAMDTRNMHSTAERSTSDWLVVLFIAAVAIVALAVFHTATPATVSEQPTATLAAAQPESGVQPLQGSLSGAHDSCDGACDTEHQLFETSCVLTMLFSWSLLDVTVSQQSVQLLPRDTQLVPGNTTARATPGDFTPSLQQLSISRT